MLKDNFNCNIKLQQLIDKRAHAYNELSDKMIEAGLDILLLKNLIYTIEELEKFIYKEKT